LNEKKKILLLIDWFAPGYKAGGPIQSCVNISLMLKKDYDMYVLTTDTDHGEKKPYEGIPANKWITNLDPDVHVYYAKKSALNLKQLKSQILDANAEIVYLNHLFSPKFVLYPLWLKYTRRLKSKVVVSPRGALYESALAVKPIKKKPFLWLFKFLRIYSLVTFHATNEREKEAILHYFPGSDVVVADNLPNTNQPAFVGCEKNQGTVKCIFIARIVPIKNLLFLLNVIRNIKDKVELTIIGPVEDESYWNECKKMIAENPSNIKVNYEGPKRNDELISFIRKNHLFILPTTGENFGHSIFESLLAGRPVLISDQTPWLNLADKKAGWELPLDHPEKFKEIIESVAAFDQAAFDGWAQGAWQYAKSFIENSELHQKYLELFS